MRNREIIKTIVLAGSPLCILFAKWFPVTDLSLLNSVLWNFLALIVLVAVVIKTLFFKDVEVAQEKVIKQLRKSDASGMQMINAIQQFSNASEDLRQDINIIFWVLLNAVVLALWNYVSFPIIDVFFSLGWISKVQFIYGASGCLILIAIVASWDIIETWLILSFSIWRLKQE